MKGIERIHILSDWNDAYIQINRQCEPTANALYPLIFAGIGMPLVNGEVEVIECTKDEAMARYDWKEGVDVILHFSNGKATMQEKFLTYDGPEGSTLTVETHKTSGAPGAWFYCTAQYYFVSYARRMRFNDFSFQDWILVDWPGLHRADSTQHLRWRRNQNHNLGRRAIFQYLLFDDVPAACVVARHGKEITAPIQQQMVMAL